MFNLGGNLNSADFELQIRRLLVELVKPVVDRQEVAQIDNSNIKRKLEANSKKMIEIDTKLKSINKLATENGHLKLEIKHLNEGINLVKDSCDQEIYRLSTLIERTDSQARLNEEKIRDLERFLG